MQRAHIKLCFFQIVDPSLPPGSTQLLTPAKAGENILAPTEIDGKLDDQWFVSVNLDSASL